MRGGPAPLLTAADVAAVLRVDRATGYRKPFFRARAIPVREGGRGRRWLLADPELYCSLNRGAADSSRRG